MRIRVFVKREVFSIEIILSAYKRSRTHARTHAHTHTHTHTHTRTHEHTDYTTPNLHTRVNSVSGCTDPYKVMTDGCRHVFFRPTVTLSRSTCDRAAFPSIVSPCNRKMSSAGCLYFTMKCVFQYCKSSGAVWKKRWTSWTPRPYSFCGCKVKLNEH